MKRLLSLLLVAALLSLGAAALTSCDKNELTFTRLSDGTYGVSAVRPERIESAMIPATHEGVAVTAILPRAFEGAIRLREVAIPEGITSVGDAAFASCTALTSVSLPSSLTYVGSSVFDGCTALAFTERDGAYYLGNAEAPTLYLAAIKDREATAAAIAPKTRFIASRAFYGCPYLAEVTLPAGLLAVGAEAFGRCPALAAVTISDLAAFCRIAFADEAANPAAVAGTLSLGGTPLTSLTVPAGVTAIGSYAFLGLPLTEISLPESVVAIGDYAFAKTAVTAVTLPSGLTVIGRSAFTLCPALREINVPSGVIYIGREAFFGCTALERATFGKIENWYVSGVPLSPEDIETPEVAAGTLVGGFNGSIWTQGK